VNREEVLDLAKQYVTKDRQADHGELEQTFDLIARLWSVYKGAPFNATEVAMMLALLKAARQRGNPKHEDNYTDLAGYAACAAELNATTR
jgi:hypothetical protein